MAQLAEALDRRRGRCDALAAEGQRLPAVRGVEQRRHLPARPVQVRFDDLERETRGHCGVERVAAPLEHCHAGRGGEPVCRRDHAERPP